MPTIVIFTKIKTKKKLVFDLSRSIDLHKISTKKTNEKAIAGKTAGLIGLNETVTWRAKHLGIYQNFTSKVTGCDASDYFADEALLSQMQIVIIIVSGKYFLVHDWSIIDIHCAIIHVHVCHLNVIQTRDM